MILLQVTCTRADFDQSLGFEVY